MTSHPRYWDGQPFSVLRSWSSGSRQPNGITPGMTRMPALVAAVALLVFGSATGAPTAAVDNPSTTLTLQLTASDAMYAVSAQGTAPAGTLTVADETGTHSASVTAKDGPCPPDGEARTTTLTGNTWCLTVVGVPAGYKMTGKLVGGASTIVLAIQRKAGPLLPVITGVLVPYLGCLGDGRDPLPGRGSGSGSPHLWRTLR